MTDRSIIQVAGADPQPGTGILRPFPSPALAHLDPFVFLDTGAPLDLGRGDIYVGPHAHRGVQPTSLLFRGRIEHRDSLGNHAVVESGGSQWLVAGAGALHEEILHGDEAGVFHMAQLWVNLPAANKMDPAAHHAVGPEQVPLIDDVGSGASIRLYAGELAGRSGPVPLATPVLVAHVTLAAGGSVSLPADPAWTAAFTVVDGEATAGGHDLGPGDTPVFGPDGDTVSVSTSTGGQILVMFGAPLNEPIATGRGFVMNTRAEIEAAITDEASGRMGTLEASR